MSLEADRFQRAEELFHAVAELAAEERRRFLEAECGADAELLSRVEALLAASSRRASFLEEPALHRFMGEAPVEVDAELELPCTLGPFRLVRELGRGGMGRVYLAEQATETFRRPVALKLLGWSAPFRERFRAEQRILAALEHPGIARLYDAGTTADGRPYLAMEYVEGSPLTEHCAARRLDLAARLALFRRVCNAVEHAHRHLVVHRDLKPANILVTAAGEPKLLDFGIAKLLQPEGEGAGETVAGLRLMTPEYASPEQLAGGPISTASDVYSLGVVLYELLTGERPHRVPTGSIEEADRIVREQEARRPSTVPRTGERAHAIPFDRRKLRGELDTIVLQALAKEPSRRYPSAAALAEDLRRWEAGLPISARADTVAYRARKFARRHVAGVAAASIALLSLVGGLAVALWQAREARIERARAERRFADVRELATRFLFGFHDAIETLPGATAAREMVVGTGVEFLDRLSAESAGDPELAAELARGYLRLGNLQGGRMNRDAIGKVAEAHASYGKGLALAEAALAARPGDPAVRRTLSQLAVGMGQAEFQRGESVLAETHLRRGLELSEAILAQAPEDVATRAEAVSAALRLSEALGMVGRTGVAESVVRRAAAIAAHDGAPWHSSTEARGALIQVYNVLAYNCTVQERWPEAIASVERLLGLVTDHAAAAPADAGRKHDLATIWGQVGWIHARGGEPDRALEAAARSRQLLEEIAASDPANRQARENLAIAAESEAEAEDRRGNATASREAFRRAVEHYDRLTLEDPHNAYFRAYLGYELVRIGETSLALGDEAAAEAALRRADAVLTEGAQDLQDAAAARARGLAAQAALALRRARLDEAVERLRRAEEAWLGLAAKGPLPPSLAARSRSTSEERARVEALRASS
jgi:non-specific serine/threonine protein kinase/serine/threonine-protein kinase